MSQQLKKSAEIEAAARRMAEKYCGPVITQMTSSAIASPEDAAVLARGLTELRPGVRYYVLQSPSGAFSVADGIPAGYVPLGSYCRLHCVDRWRFEETYPEPCSGTLGDVLAQLSKHSGSITD